MINRDKTASHKEKSTLLQKYLQNGVKSLSHEDIQLLIFSVTTDNELEHVKQIMMENSALWSRDKRSSYLLNLYFWLCYTNSDADRAIAVFQACHQIFDSVHVRARYYSVLFERKRYSQIIEDYENRNCGLRIEQLIYMAALCKDNTLESYQKAKEFARGAEAKGRTFLLYSLLCMRQGDFNEPARLLNLKVHQDANVPPPRNLIVYNLQLLCLTQSQRHEEALALLEKWTRMGGSLKVSMEVIKELEQFVKSQEGDTNYGDRVESLRRIFDKLKTSKGVSQQSVEEMVFTPIDLNDTFKKKK